MTNKFSDLKKGDILDLRGIILDQKFTKPPSRYSQASLIKKLEELGIGRPSTYATIISTLQDRSYVENQKNQMKPTNLGMQVNHLLSENFKSVTSSELTAEMEDKLDKISTGDKTYEEVVSMYWDDLNTQIRNSNQNIEDNRSKYKLSQTDEKCPICDSKMDIIIGRFGEFFQCSNIKEHQFALNYKEYAIELEKAQKEYSDLTKGLKCEECGDDLIVRVSKSSLKAYIACAKYRVGNKHTVKSIKSILDPDSTKKQSLKFKKKRKAYKKKK